MQRSRDGIGRGSTRLSAVSWTTLAALAASGTAAAVEVPGVGHDGQGAGIEITNLDADARLELILMAYDAPAGANNFRYAVRRNEAVAQNIWLEMDKLAGAACRPAGQIRRRPAVREPGGGATDWARTPAEPN